MCVTDLYTELYPDGRRTEHSRPSLCERSRHGKLCDDPVVYRHPPRYIQYKDAAPAVLPPTPRLTPRSATPTYYRSGDESDRSHHSHHSSSSTGHKRSSGVYVNGQKVLDFESKRSSKRNSRTERIVIVDSPPTARTPPQQFTMPHTAPPSPNVGVAAPYFAEPSASRDTGLRPVIVDERPRPVHINLNAVPLKSAMKKPKAEQQQPQQTYQPTHARQPSTESRHSSRHSHSSDEEAAARRQRRREDKARAEEELRRQRVRASITAHNDEIARRPAVPVPKAPKRSMTMTAGAAAAAVGAYVRPAVEVTVATPVDRQRELEEAVRKLEISKRSRQERERRAVERAARDEEEAQRRRLMERMQPRRRATVGPGARRHRVVYEDGLYRWE